ncbi:MAG: LytR/AlgR family response regulator transcription factor [Acidithiobacillales bacterium]
MPSGSGVLSAVVVDDEPPARQLLRELLGKIPSVRIAAECANGFEAVKAIGEHAPDVVFLDIQMPKLDGFEVLSLLPRREDGRPAVVFVTAYDQYAVRAFEANAVDYLLKPFDLARLGEAVERVRTRLSSGRPGPPSGLAVAARDPSQSLSRVVVRDGANITVLPVTTIDWIKAEDDYVLVRAGGRDHLKAEPLASLEAQLPKDRFVRIHRSYLMNLDRLVRLEAGATGTPIAVLKGGTSLPVSRAGARRLRERIGA